MATASKKQQETAPLLEMLLKELRPGLADVDICRFIVLQKGVRVMGRVLCAPCGETVRDARAEGLREGFVAFLVADDSAAIQLLLPPDVAAHLRSGDICELRHGYEIMGSVGLITWFTRVVAVAAAAAAACLQAIHGSWCIIGPYCGSSRQAYPMRRVRAATAISAMSLVPTAGALCCVVPLLLPAGSPCCLLINRT